MRGGVFFGVCATGGNVAVQVAGEPVVVCLTGAR